MCEISYIRVSCVGSDDSVRELVMDNDELIDFVLEVFEGEERLDYSNLQEPLKTSIKMCINGEFKQHTPKPDLLKAQLEQNDLKCYCNFKEDKAVFNPKILNHIVYKNKAPK